MLDRPDFYNKNLLETYYDEENRVTWDECNVCNTILGSWDVSELDSECEGGYFVESYKERDIIGANDIDRELEDDSFVHMLQEHEAETTLISMDKDNELLLRQLIGDKVIVND